MTRRRSVPSHVRQIKMINAVFRRLKDKDGPRADSLRERKDALIDAMAETCPHDEVIGTRGGGTVAACRICCRCGYSESEALHGFSVLTEAKAAMLPLDEFRLRTGLILKDLGINL